MPGHSRGENYKRTTTITMEEELLLIIDKFQDRNRKNIKNRSQAIEKLVKMGLKQLKEQNEQKRQQAAVG